MSQALRQIIMPLGEVVQAANVARRSSPMRRILEDISDASVAPGSVRRSTVELTADDDVNIGDDPRMEGADDAGGDATSDDVASIESDDNLAVVPVVDEVATVSDEDSIMPEESSSEEFSVNTDSSSIGDYEADDDDHGETSSSTDYEVVHGDELVPRERLLNLPRPALEHIRERVREHIGERLRVSSSLRSERSNILQLRRNFGNAVELIRGHWRRSQPRVDLRDEEIVARLDSIADIGPVLEDEENSRGEQITPGPSP